jgi:hypothetical protein
LKGKPIINPTEISTNTFFVSNIEPQERTTDYLAAVHCELSLKFYPTKNYTDKSHVFFSSKQFDIKNVLLSANQNRLTKFRKLTFKHKIQKIASVSENKNSLLKYRAIDRFSSFIGKTTESKISIFCGFSKVGNVRVL